MKPTTREWITKAEDDFHVAQMSYRARSHPSYDAAVFHCQQCAEKYLKARLEEGGIAFMRTHDLLVLHQSVLSIEPAWMVMQPFLISLNPLGVAYRYPGTSATRLDVKRRVEKLSRSPSYYSGRLRSVGLSRVRVMEIETDAVERISH